jgi:sigma-E factor negative regulatory protein RseB
MVSCLMSEWSLLNHRNNIKLKYFFIFSLLFLGSTGFSYADSSAPKPEVLIDEMSKASRDLNYDGVFVYRLGKQMDTMRIIHKSGEDGIYERLITLSGNAREVIRDKDQVKCFFPDDKKVVVDKSRSGKLVSSYLPSPIESISEFYKFELAGDDRVAGMEAWIVNIRPNDKYRYGYQLWIEKKSRLLLKSELKNQLGVTLEQVMFTQLEVLNDIDNALLQPSVSGKDFKWYNNVNTVNFKNDNEKKWQVTSMPVGFSMSNQEKKPMMTSHTPVEHLVYTDGLATVSVYVEKLIGKEDLEATVSSFGGVNTYSTHIEDYQITAVGEVPKVTVKLMANSVKSFH